MHEACHGRGSKRSAAPDRGSCTNPAHKPGAPETGAGDGPREGLGRGRAGGPLATPAGPRTVGSMTETQLVPTPPGAAPVVLDLAGVQARYGIGKTKAIELVNSPGFPAAVVPGMHRYPLAALEAWELAHSLAGTLADPARAAAPAPVIVAAPERGRPGPKPGAKRAVA